jgi:hypothetical protein
LFFRAFFDVRHGLLGSLPQYTTLKITFDGKMRDYVIKLHKYDCITILRLKNGKKHVILLHN